MAGTRLVLYEASRISEFMTLAVLAAVHLMSDPDLLPYLVSTVVGRPSIYLTPAFYSVFKNWCEQSVGAIACLTPMGIARIATHFERTCVEIIREDAETRKRFLESPSQFEHLLRKKWERLYTGRPKVDYCTMVSAVMPDTTGFGYFPMVALINHSNMPNCELQIDWEARPPAIEVIALCDIPPGAELVISYCTDEEKLRNQYQIGN